MNDTPTTRRPRFSLRTLFTLTTWLAMGITIYLQCRELKPLRVEVKKLRDQTGQLWIDDKSKVHAIQVESDESKLWIWRVWIPAGRKYRLHVAAGTIPPAPSLLPKGGFQILKSNCEVLVRHRIFTDRESGKLVSFTKMSGDGWNSELSANECDWSTDNPLVSIEGVKYSQESFKADQPVVLIRRREGVFGSMKMTDPAPGFLIWIAPAN